MFFPGSLDWDVQDRLLREVQWPLVKCKLFKVRDAQFGCWSECLCLSHLLWPSAYQHWNLVTIATLQVPRRRTHEVSVSGVGTSVNVCLSISGFAPLLRLCSGLPCRLSNKCQPRSTLCLAFKWDLVKRCLLNISSTSDLRPGVCVPSKAVASKGCAFRGVISVLSTWMWSSEETLGDPKDSENLSLGGHF